MNYEKKYKEALERARQFIEHPLQEDSANIVEYLFPELIEGEEEKIRKDIISYLRNEKIVKRYISDIEVDKWIAWLEKQKSNTCKREIDDAYLQGMCDAKHEIEKQSESTTTNIEIPFGAKDSELQEVSYYIPEGFYAEIKDDMVVIKKAEPKFKVGNWIVFNGLVLYIYEIVDGYYKTVDIDGIPCSYDWAIDNIARLWSINDAKDGDVLFHSDSASNGIFIFKEILQCGTLQKVVCYCDYDSEDGFCLGEKHTCCCTTSKILHPATKKQRDLLFEKMKEAGYSWNSEKKELKKF